MGQLLDSAIQFLTDGDWRFMHSEDDNWASLHYTGGSGSWLSWFQDRGSCLIAYAVCPVKAPSDRWPAISELVGRANYGLGAGNFEMNFEDGTIRYKSGIYMGDEPLTVALVRDLFYIANTTMDDYLPAIMAVMYGDTLPQLAVARAEEAIEARRLSRSAAALASDETLVGDAINPELAALLATLSSG